MMEFVAEAYAAIKSLWVVWLILVFLGLVVWVYWPGHKKRLEAHRDIPFEDQPFRDQSERGC